MNATLDPVVAALAQLTDGELAALIDATNDVPQIAPGLLAWVEHVCDWEQNRRGGLDFPLQPPEAAIDPSENAVSITAAVFPVCHRVRGIGRGPTRPMPPLQPHCTCTPQ